MTAVAVLLPSKGRAAQLRSRLADLLAQEMPKGVDLLVVASAIWGDAPTWQVLADLEVVFESLYAILRPLGSNAVDGWQRAFDEAYDLGVDWFVLGADDIVWRPGWLAEALRVAGETAAQVVGLNDGHTNLDDYAPHYMASRSFCEAHLGGRMIPEGYRCWWFDRHVCQLAQELGLYAPAWKALAEHRHPDWQTAPMDETYRQSLHDRDLDRAYYTAWRKKAVTA